MNELLFIEIVISTDQETDQMKIKTTKTNQKP